MKNIFKFFGTILTVVLAAFCMTGCLAEDDLGTADLGLHVKVFFPTKVVAGQPMTINGSGFAEATEIVFPGEVVVTDFQIVSNDMIRVNAPKGIAAEGGKIVVCTAEEQVESPLPLTLGETKISGYSVEEGQQVDGGSQITIYGTDLEFIKAVELLDADGNPAFVEDKIFNKKATASIIFTVPKKVYEGTFVGKVHTIDGKTFEMPELTYKPAADGGYWETQKIMIWENDGTYGQIAWSSDYRFALEGTNGNGDAIVAEIPADTWAIMKDGTFYMTISGGDAYQIRITTGWWTFDKDGVYDIHNGNERLVDNGDGTFTLAVTISEEPLKSGIYDLIDVEHLLLTGNGYTIHNLYYTEDIWVEGGGSVEIVRTSIWKNDGSVGAAAWSSGSPYRFAPDFNSTGEEIYAIPAETWEKMKTTPFKVMLQPASDASWQIRVLDAWWSVGNDQSGALDFTASSEGVVDNGDGTFTFVLDVTTHPSPDTPLVDIMDAQHLLFAGDGFIINELYWEEEIIVPGGGEPAEVVVWENDGSVGTADWNGSPYRFGLEGMDGNNECVATFPADIWEQLKSKPFKVYFKPGEGAEWWQIRILDGYWSIGNNEANDISPNTPDRYVDNGDGTFHFVLDLNAYPEDGDKLVSTVDEKHLLFGGSGFVITKIAL